MMKNMNLYLISVVLPVLVACLSILPARAEPITVTDILGRQVTLQAPATRLVLGQGRHMQVLSMLHPDPVGITVGWKDDMKRDPSTLAAFRARFPKIDEIPSIGGASDASFSVERTISLNPDLVILSLYVGEVADEETMKQLTGRLAAAGIPVVFVDFFVHPLRDTVPSLKILGRLLGREAQSDRLISFYEAHLKAVTDRTASLTNRPDVFMHVHAAPDSCCFSPGKGVFNDFIEAAGGHNIAADVLPGVTGEVSLEYLISRNPTFYVATGGVHMKGRGGLVLGTGVSQETASMTFRTLLAAPGIAGLTAVQESRAFALWHLFNDTPLHIVMIEVLARNLHPELFPGLMPEETLAALNAFSAVPLTGTFWIGLDGR